jgi:hypothetical protein
VDALRGHLDRLALRSQLRNDDSHDRDARHQQNQLDESIRFAHVRSPRGAVLFASGS